jgi:C1A family cysteine protease
MVHDRAAIVLLVLFATLVAFGLICQSSLASTRAPIATSGARATASGARATASGTQTFSLAPLSPAYTRYLRMRSLSRSSLRRDAHGLGYIPSPIDFSYLSRAGARSVTLGAYPISYDLRDLGRLTDIEDQGQTGCCWTFATMGSLESGLLPSDPESFSEDNLALNSGFDSALAGADSAYNSGGNALMSTAYLTSWAGPVLASQDAFDDGYTPDGLVAAKHVQDVLYLPARTSSSDNDAIKAAIMTYGAVYTSMYADEDGMCSSADSEYYNAETDSYYFDGGTGQQDHAVDIVGWNDNYAASNFSSNGVTDQPPGNGAFIVRNSWGTYWGDAGYFYVSYYDTNFGRDENAAFDDAEPTSDFNGIYQYDPLGWTNGAGYGDDATTDWGANRFTATASDQLAAVSFYAAEPGTLYTVYAGDSLSSLTARGSGTMPMGYHTVDLSSPLQLTSGQPFVVAVELTTPGDIYPIPVEYPAYGASAASASPGESYVSANGSQWTDLTTLGGFDQANVCLKAFTRPAGTDVIAPTTTVTPAKDYEVGYWNNAPCGFTFSAADNAGGSGVDTTQYDLDGQGWTLWSQIPGTQFVVPAPADHTNDGQHTFLVRSTDVAGNAETPQSFSLAIDTRRPSSKAPSAAHVRRGSYATLKFEALDTAPCYGRCLVVITVKTLKGAHRLTLSPTTWYKCGKVVSYRFKCKLARGKYRFFVTTTDGATNRSSKTSANYLTVT